MMNSHLIYICMSFQSEETNKNLIIHIPILLKRKKKFSLGFYHLEGFSSL